MTTFQQEQLIDYENLELDENLALGLNSAMGSLVTAQSNAGLPAATPDLPPDQRKKQLQFSGIHTTGFKDFLLKPELQKAVVECGFEHPSQVQQECIPQSMLGVDVLCQAKSGMGKTAVFVLNTL